MKKAHIEDGIEKTERFQKADGKADERWVHWAASEVEKNEDIGNRTDTGGAESSGVQREDDPQAAEVPVPEDENGDLTRKEAEEEEEETVEREEEVRAEVESKQTPSVPEEATAKVRAEVESRQTPSVPEDASKAEKRNNAADKETSPAAKRRKDKDHWEDPEGRISKLCKLTAKDIVREQNGYKPMMNDYHEE